MPIDPLFLSFQEAVAGRYSLERELGRGGMGVVYLAREVRLDRPVAIKVLPPARGAQPALRERFLREARTAAKLSHPNIIPIHAVDEVQGFVFFAMAYVEGETITDRVAARGPLPPSEAARVLREVAWALAYAHDQNVIHRDVKPDNIMLEATSGRVLVADFGIAGLVRGAAGLGGGEVIGTPEFMSPEQALGEEVDGRSDLYAFGVTAFFVFTGRLPFEAASATEMLAKQVTAPPPRVADVASGIPRRLAQLVESCLAKDRSERPANAAEVAERLGQALDRKKELPLALRAFVKHDSRFGGAGVLLYPFGLLLGSVLVGTVFGVGGATLSLIAGLTVVPLGVFMARVRRLLRSGFDHGDLTLGFKAELDQQTEERGFGIGPGATGLERVLKLCSALGSLGTLLGIFGFGAFSAYMPSWAAGLTAASMVVAVGCGFGMLILLQRRRDVDTDVYGRFWRGPIGRWLFGVARALTPARSLPAPLTHRPTELSLGMAADKLYADLPKETQQQLRDLPDVVRRLEDDAQRMRRRMEELQDALGDGEGGREKGEEVVSRHDRIAADLRAERELVRQRLKDAVAALETIRLNLLRLHAGTATVKHLTTDLGLARQVAREVDLLLQSQREVEELL
jgi:eukaryotic-like serine/threonine-protein kinase